MGNSLDISTDLFDPLMRAGFRLPDADQIIAAAKRNALISDFKDDIAECLIKLGREFTAMVPMIWAQERETADAREFYFGVRWSEATK